MINEIDCRLQNKVMAGSILLALSLLFFPAICFAGKISIGERAANSTVSMQVGDDLAISLTGNPTTGYIWEKVKGRKKILRGHGDYQYVADSTQAGFGRHIYLFF